jgi:hypothetical protein
VSTEQYGPIRLIGAEKGAVCGGIAPSSAAARRLEELVVSCRGRTFDPNGVRSSWRGVIALTGCSFYTDE